ncbi:MAG: hypothetical protein ACT4QC_20920 [Planctomycetaceae bacterium]
MHCPFGTLLLWAALNGSPTTDATVYDDYKQAYLAAKSTNRPILLVINPGSDSDLQPHDLDVLRRSGHRRELLGNYVVAVIDASTSDGQSVHKLFGSPPLPRVSVIDKQQKWQIFRSSQAFTPEDWNVVLEKYQAGESPPVAAPKCNCANARR